MGCDALSRGNDARPLASAGAKGKGDLKLRGLLTANRGYWLGLAWQICVMMMRARRLGRPHMV